MSVMQLIGESLTASLSKLADYETYFAEGDTGELRLYVDQTLSQEDIDRLEAEILSQGVILTAPIVQDVRTIVIRFQKAIAPLPIIAGVAVVGLLGWQLFKSGDVGLPSWIWIAGGAIVLYAVSRRKKKWLGKR